MEAQIIQFHSRDDVAAQIERLDAMLAAYRKRKLMEDRASMFAVFADIEGLDQHTSKVA